MDDANLLISKAAPLQWAFRAEMHPGSGIGNPAHALEGVPASCKRSRVANQGKAILAATPCCADSTDPNSCACGSTSLSAPWTKTNPFNSRGYWR
jgi:hypothetical protein